MEPVKEFLEPIKRKYIYHFIVSPKTSLIEKPEWYLNQSLRWIYENLEKVESDIKISHNDNNKSEIRQLFILGMVELAHRRLSKDIKTFIDTIEEDPQSEKILIHTYNEVVQYVKVIRQLLGDKYKDLDQKYDMMALFSHQKLFEKIFDVEWEYAKRNLKEITQSDNKWDPILEGDYIDYYKIPRCVDRFLLLIKALSERVECFRQPDCQFQLIDLQSYLFKKFLDAMKQNTEVSTVSKNIFTDIFFLTDDSTIDLSKILRVLNGVSFIRLILQEKCYIPVALRKDMDKDLSEKLNRITDEYVSYRNKLIDRVVGIYEQVSCDHENFLNFIKPKLSYNIYELIRDEAAKIHQKIKTQNMLRGLSLG